MNNSSPPADPTLIAGTRQILGLFFKPDPLVGWRMVPGRVGCYRKPAFTTRIEINDHGFRGPNFSLEKPEGVRRILLLADSFGAAIEVEEGKIFARVMERALNAGRAGEGKGRVEVINASTGAFGTEQELLLFRELGPKLKPDLVLLGFHFGDDIIENSVPMRKLVPWRSVKLPRPYFTLDEAGELVLEGHPPDPRVVKRAWQRYIDLLTWAQREHIDPGFRASPLERVKRAFRRARDILGNRIRNLRTRRVVPFDLLTYRNPPDAMYEASWRLSEKILSQMKIEAEAAGAAFRVVGICTREQVEAGFLEQRLGAGAALASRPPFDLDYPGERLGAILARLAVPYLDLTPVFRARHRADHSLFISQDIHWSELGHEVGGQAIARFLAEDPG